MQMWRCTSRPPSLRPSLPRTKRRIEKNDLARMCFSRMYLSRNYVARMCLSRMYFSRNYLARMCLERTFASWLAAVRSLAAAASPPCEDVPLEDVPLEELPREDMPLEDVPLEDIPLEELPREDVIREDVRLLARRGPLVGRRRLPRAERCCVLLLPLGQAPFHLGKPFRRLGVLRCQFAGRRCLPRSDLLLHPLGQAPLRPSAAAIGLKGAAAAIGLKGGAPPPPPTGRASSPAGSTARSRRDHRRSGGQRRARNRDPAPALGSAARRPDNWCRRSRRQRGRRRTGGRGGRGGWRMAVRVRNGLQWREGWA